MGLQRIVIVGAALVVAFAPVVGCGSDSKSESGSSAESDEQQIRDLVDEQEAAVEDLDFDKMADLTCEKYREDVRNQKDELIPPISDYGTKQELAETSRAELVDEFKTQFPDASDATIERFADALVSYDEEAYNESFLDLVRESSSITVDKVENIKIDGDTATADITSTSTSGDEAPETKTEPNKYVKEDGKWLDCEKPES
jgi:hypothetical protein